MVCLFKGLCAHIATHDGCPTHSVCTASEWSGTEACFGRWPARCCWWGRVLQGWHVQMGVRNETATASELLLEHWECWFVAERGTWYLLSRASLMLSQCQFNALTVYVATWGTIVQGTLERVFRFQILQVQYFVFMPHLHCKVRTMRK
jgi:hypothetical protein